MRPILLPTLLFVLTVVAAGPALAQQAVEAPMPVAGAMAWSTLNAEQRTALKPLATLWPTLAPDHQRKWVALAQNFNRMHPDEQATLQSRMSEWAQLTPAQRTQARLNFGEVRRAVPADERRAKWEEYQALPAEERERLANDRPKPPISAAPALRPVSPDKILRPATPPAVAVPGTAVVPGGVRPVGPTGSVNRNTLLPQSTASAPAPAR